MRRGFVVAGSLLLLVGVAVAAPSSASAEIFADVYLGGAITQDSDVDVDVEGVGGFSADDVDLDGSVVVGGRFGYWWDWIGVGLDVAYWGPDPDVPTVAGTDPVLGAFSLRSDLDQDVYMVALPIMVRGRFLRDDQVPAGRVQLYGFAGPALFISTLEASVTATAAAFGTARVDDDDTATSLGVEAGAGATYMFTRNVGIFGEYRLTHFSPDYDLTLAGLSVGVDGDVTSHHFVAGVTFRY